MVDPDDDLIDGRELALWLGVSERTPERWRTEKTGPPWIRVGGAVRYRKSDVREWLRQQTMRN
jgi:excisionase family DNA binding protein